MKFIFWAVGGFLCMWGCLAGATSLGWVGVPKIVSMGTAPAICLPSDAKEAFPVSRVLVAESYTRNSLDWALYLEPDAAPLLLNPGACIKFGEVLEGYKLDGESMLSKLKPNFTYVFMIDRVQDAEHYNYFYSATFCVKENPDGSVKYLQYRRIASGGEVVPSCDAKRNGNVSE